MEGFIVIGGTFHASFSLKENRILFFTFTFYISIIESCAKLCAEDTIEDHGGIHNIKRKVIIVAFGQIWYDGEQQDTARSS